MDSDALDARAALREALAHWPIVTPAGQAFLQRLPHRVYRAVVLVWGEGLSRTDAACRMGVHEATVGRYLHMAYRRWAGERRRDGPE